MTHRRVRNFTGLLGKERTLDWKGGKKPTFPPPTPFLREKTKFSGLKEHLGMEKRKIMLLGFFYSLKLWKRN